MSAESSTPSADIERKFQRELNAGLTALMVLAVIQRARRPMYGYEVAAHLSGLADDALPMTQGALYPVLRSLEKQELLTSHIEASDAGPPRKYYTLTAQGRRTLDEWIKTWHDTKDLVDRVLEIAHGNRPRNAARRAAVS
jgi:PadR family transcriptional regulator, regulatory protein PadR